MELNMEKEEIKRIIEENGLVQELRDLSFCRDESEQANIGLYLSIWNDGKVTLDLIHQIIPVVISHVTKRECEMRGGSWVDEYRKSDGTMVKGYCREIEWNSSIDQEYWQQNEWEKRRR